MSRTATMSRFAAPAGNEEAKVIAWCACGCTAEIVKGYVHYECDGEWYYDEECFLKRMERKGELPDDSTGDQGVHDISRKDAEDA